MKTYYEIHRIDFIHGSIAYSYCSLQTPYQKSIKDQVVKPKAKIIKPRRTRQLIRPIFPDALLVDGMAHRISVIRNLAGSWPQEALNITSIERRRSIGSCLGYILSS
jgi:hypothetical protein